MQRFLLSFLRLTSFLMLSALMAGGDTAATTFGALAMLFPVALMALGALRGGRLGKAWVALLALGLVLELGFWGMLSLRGQVLDGPWILGLPVAAVIFLAFLWWVPLVLVSLTYAGTFGDHGVTEAGLDRLRQASAKYRARVEDSASKVGAS